MVHACFVKVYCRCTTYEYIIVIRCITESGLVAYQLFLSIQVATRVLLWHMRGNMQINKFSDISLERVSKLKVCQSADQLKFGIVHRIIIVGLMNLFGVCENVSHLYSIQVILLFYCRWSGMLYPLTRTTALYLSKLTQLVSFQNQQSICILQPPKMLYIQCNCDAIGVEWRESVTNVRWPLTGLLDHYFISADLLLLLYYWNPRGIIGKDGFGLIGHLKTVSPRKTGDAYEELNWTGIYHLAIS